ncbi:hypothetical protein SAMN04487967_0651 [Natronorubrum sediminis]|uniref:DUF7845 domain-containing protein n=1 Tax=Natronorubrum sediminis TaxID=640943 RepID=A0A1H6FMJ6_9EURY|nr:hypothetical protein [Natronorubrum sediminis]SEH12096.1 hypothetical protein SAMN04487967_0651 [Natronorubrum sediminis]
MASQQFLETQYHEFDAYLNFDEYGLKPYYGLTTFRKAHDWVNNGKPSTTAQIREVDLEDIGDPFGADVDQDEATFRLGGCGRDWQLEVAVLDSDVRA